MSDATVEFSVLASMLDAVVRAKKGQLKRKHVRTFLDHVYTDHEFFSAMRLMLPNLDKDRGNYGLKEAVLAKSLAEALCLSKESEDAQKLLNWRKGGTRAGSNAGNFSFVATEILCRRQRVTSTGLKIKDVNDLLDRLAVADRREEKVGVLGDMINKTNAQEMRWIIMIILKDLKLGISEKSFFSEFHPDAEDLFNVTCDLKLVCEKLRNRNERYDRQDIEVGKAVRPQLAARVANVEGAWKKFRGKQVIVECKFDGDRIQIHKNGSSVNFFSRNFIDHQEFKEGVANLIIENVLPDKCILDGEMLVWDRSTKRFADFGTNREAAKAAKDGLDTSQQLCYVAFDILYHGNSSVIHLPLRERHQLLVKAVKPLQGRLELLLPNSNTQRNTGDSNWSFIASCPEEVEHFFQQTVENREEGIILKDLDSKWEPSDRSGKWLKLKPDYVHTGSDLDVLIIGGYYGSGRRGGQVAQFLLGIAEPPKAGQCPTRFFSFCKVGTGLTDEESDHLVQKLRPYFRRYEKNTKPPSCYVVTNNAKERPDVWIDQPDKSVILEITSDIRTIKTEVFAAPYGLRFPRVHKVRYEKPWYDCLDVQALVDMVQSRSGSTVDSKNFEGKENKAKRSKRQKKPEARFMPLVPSHMRVTDVRHVKRATQIFERLVFYFANYSQEYTKESVHKIVVENGGTFSMNLNDEITHALACEKKGLKYLASASHGDIIHYSWLMDCCTTKTLLPIRPKYFLHLSTQTKTKMKAEIDDHGDDYFVDIDSSDLKQLFENIEPSKLVTENDELAHYKKKYCPSSTFCQFRNCNFYFHKPIHSRNIDSQLVAETALIRQSLEVSMYEGMISETLTSDVTHMIVYTSPNHSLSFKTIFKSIAPGDRRFLMSDKLKVFSHHWIDDHGPGTYGDPAEAKYDLRDPSFVYGVHEMDDEKQLGSNENSGCGRSSDMKEADSRIEVDEDCTAENQGVPPTGSLSPRGVPKSSNGPSPEHDINEEKPAKAAERMEIDNGTNANQKVPRIQLVTLPKVSRSSKRKNTNHRVKEEKPEDEEELNRRVIGNHGEVGGCVTSWDVSKPSGSTEVDNYTTRDQETPRTRVITMPEVPRSSKRRKSNLHIKEKNPAEGNILDRRENRSIKLGHQVIQESLDARCARAELASDTVKPSDPKASRIWEPTETSRGSCTSKEAEVNCMLDADDFSLDGMLGDLIPSYNSTQEQAPTQRSSTEEKPPALETTLIPYPLVERELRDSHLKGNPADVVVSMQDADRDADVRKSVLDNLTIKTTDTVVNTPVRKKKVSYKNIVSNLLNNPP